MASKSQTSTGYQYICCLRNSIKTSKALSPSQTNASRSLKLLPKVPKSTLQNTARSRALGQGYSLSDSSSHLHGRACSGGLQCAIKLCLHKQLTPAFLPHKPATRQLFCCQLPSMILTQPTPAACGHSPLRQWEPAAAWLAVLVCHLSALKWGWWARSLLWVPQC